MYHTVGMGKGEGHVSYCGHGERGGACIVLWAWGKGGACIRCNPTVIHF